MRKIVLAEMDVCIHSYTTQLHYTPCDFHYPQQLKSATNEAITKQSSFILWHNAFKYMDLNLSPEAKK